MCSSIPPNVTAEYNTESSATNETSHVEIKNIAPTLLIATENNKKQPATVEEKIALIYRLLNESVGLLNQKVDWIAGNDTAIKALQKFKSRLELCRSDG